MMEIELCMKYDNKLMVLKTDEGISFVISDKEFFEFDAK